jgi:hypothetical protein
MKEWDFGLQFMMFLAYTTFVDCPSFNLSLISGPGAMYSPLVVLVTSLRFFPWFRLT